MALLLLRSLQIVLVLSCMAGVMGGPGWPLCYAACQSAVYAATIGACVATGGVACPAATAAYAAGQAACAASCAGTCFSNETTVTTKHGDGEVLTPMHEVRAGQMVLTLEDGRRAWTKVLQNTRVEGSFAFVRVTAEQGASAYDLTITEEHLTPRVSRPGAHGHAQLDLTKAKHVRVGDQIPMTPINQSSGAGAKVTSVERFSMSHKHVLATSAGTVVAGGLLTTTVCDDYDLIEGQQDMAGFLQAWRRVHAGLLYA